MYIVLLACRLMWSVDERDVDIIDGYHADNNNDDDDIYIMMQFCHEKSSLPPGSLL